MSRSIGAPRRRSRGRRREAEAMTAPTRTARLAEVDLPDFGMPASSPDLPPHLSPPRLERLRERMAERGYDPLVVYADREHSANLSFLTGFDPRFEEAILIVGATGSPTLRVGQRRVA